MGSSTVWQTALQELERRVSPHNFTSWFAPLTLRHLDAEAASLTLGVADDFCKAWIEDNYLDLIDEALSLTTGRSWSLRLILHDDAIDAPADLSTLRLEPPAAAARNARLRAEHHVFFDAVDDDTAAQASAATDDAVDEDDHAERCQQAGLHPERRLDALVEGDCNRFALSAARAIVEQPGERYPSLTIIGATGSGKTHLIQAIGEALLRRRPDARVVYVSAEGFVNTMVEHIRRREMAAFRERFRHRCDMLILDDVQFLRGKRSTQEELFHTLNALRQAGAQIVLAADRHPQHLDDLDERLTSRMIGGLVAELRDPGPQTRRQLIERCAAAEGLHFADDLIDLIAQAHEGPVRELEGLVVRLAARAALLGQQPTLESASAQLNQLARRRARQLSTARIIDVVADYFGITADDIRGKRRPRHISQPRQIAMFLARKHTEHSYPELGRLFGGKDHTTVLSAFRKCERRVHDDPQRAHQVAELEARLRAS